MSPLTGPPLLFTLQPHSLANSLAATLDADEGLIDNRHFPDGESYLRVDTAVMGRDCVVLAELTHPDIRYLPLMFLLTTLRELGATSVGLVAPYLSYMRQDCRFREGEAVTSRLFATDLSRHIDWLVTVDPHLHRYASLDEIYTIPSQVVTAAPALAQWLGKQSNFLLVGPDAESEQWVAGISEVSGFPYVIGAKQRRGDRDVVVKLPNLNCYRDKTAVIIDDVISSGETILQTMLALQRSAMRHTLCLAVHGIFADGADERLLKSGLEQLITTNTIVHPSNAVDMSAWIAPAVLDLLEHSTRRSI